ncbi:hypothetical protein DKQ62_16150 [Halomonas elongata]|nr:hypothetical protein DKQ62_16150 [Halomonas elongata]
MNFGRADRDQKFALILSEHSRMATINVVLRCASPHNGATAEGEYSRRGSNGPFRAVIVSTGAMPR